MSDDASLALQKAVRARLVDTIAVSDLVPPRNIIDLHGSPTRFPSIILGESQTVRESITTDRRHVRVYATLHIWTKESGLEQVKRISGAARRALRDRLVLVGCELIDGTVEEERFLRDPDGEHSHGVLTYSALIEESFE